MNAQDRNRRIYEMRKAFRWPYRDIGPMFGISGQRAQQIVLEIENRGIIDNEMEPRNDHRFTEPVSATQAAREIGIPLTTIVNWVSRGHVKVLQDPGQTGPGKVVLLDPVTLQERIDRYYARKQRKNRVSA